MSMILRKLEVERERWGPMKGTFSGSIEFEGDDGAVKLKLSNEQCEKMFAIVAEGVIETAKEVAHNLTASCLEQAGPARIEDKS